MKNKSLRANLLLLLTAVIWGSAFVAQSAGMEYVGPFTFIGIRTMLGGIVLLPVIAIMDRRAKHALPAETPNVPAYRKSWLVGGICCGVVLFAASSLQQFGILYTSVGKAGFITAMYIVMVPLLGLLFKKKVRLIVWLAVAIAAFGMYLLCINSGLEGVNRGDVLMLLCAVCFSCHILTVDHFSPYVDCVRMSCVQFIVCGALALIAMAVYETPRIGNILEAWLSIVYAGVLSAGIGYTLQIIAQKDTAPAVASLLMSLESVFAVLAGWVLLGQTLTLREIAGCALMFVAIVLAQLPGRSNGNVKTSLQTDGCDTNNNNNENEVSQNG